MLSRTSGTRSRQRTVPQTTVGRRSSAGVSSGAPHFRLRQRFRARLAIYSIVLLLGIHHGHIGVVSDVVPSTRVHPHSLRHHMASFDQSSVHIKVKALTLRLFVFTVAFAMARRDAYGRLRGHKAYSCEDTREQSAASLLSLRFHSSVIEDVVHDAGWQALLNEVRWRRIGSVGLPIVCERACWGFVGGTQHESSEN